MKELEICFYFLYVMLSRVRMCASWGTGSSAAPISLYTCTHRPFPCLYLRKLLGCQAKCYSLGKVKLRWWGLVAEKRVASIGELRMISGRGVLRTAGCIRILGQGGGVLATGH